MWRHRGMAGVKVDVPITPMLDMSFQLLFFFIINYNPNIVMEGQLDMLLPAKIEYANKEKTPQMAVPSDKELEPELEADLTILLKTQNDGANNGLISQITVRDQAGETVVRNEEELRRHLETIKSTLTNKENVKIQADSRLMWGGVMKILDVCSKAGFRGGFAQPSDLAPQ